MAKQTKKGKAAPSSRGTSQPKARPTVAPGAVRKEAKGRSNNDKPKVKLNTKLSAIGGPRDGSPSTTATRSQGRATSARVRREKSPRRAGGPAKAIATRDPEENWLKKSPLSPSELAEFRDMLLAKRRELLGDMGALSDEARSNRQDAAGDLSLMPNHMADLGSDNWEQEFTLGLLENQRQILREIDEALERIDNGTYGICLGTGKAITKARLRAKPWAKYCIEYARLLELGRVS